MVSIEDIKTITFLRENTDNDDDFVKKTLEHLNETYKNDKTRASKISRYKKFILKHNFLPMLKAEQITDEALFRKLIKQREDKPMALKKKITLSTIKKILDFKNSKNPLDVLAYLVFNSGRRINEMLKKEFRIETIDGRKELFINELLKKPNSVHPDEGYRIELIERNPEEFIELLNKYKKTNKLKHEARALDRRLKTIDIKPITSSRDFRGLYADFHKNYTPKFKNMNGVEVVKQVLNHDSRNSSIFYNDKYMFLEPMTEKELINKTNKQLRLLLETIGIKTFSYMNKKQLLELAKDKIIYDCL